MSEVIDSIHRMRSPKKLLQTFEAVKDRLEDLGISSNQTDPVGQYAEYLVKELYDAEKTTNGTAGCDLVTKDGVRIEVKGRVARSEGYIPKTYINNSNVSEANFDYLVYVVFNKKYEIEMALGMTIDVFKDNAEFVDHNNSAPKWKFLASPELKKNKDIEDLTPRLSEFQ